MASAQAADPRTDFAIQLRRAFPAAEADEATAAGNRAALIALAMFVVDRRVGDLARLTDAQTAGCSPPSTLITLHGRADLPKHWALSAALAAGIGVQLAESLGEWKELADSLSKQSSFQPGDPTGFSFVDLSADRSGSRAASAATGADPARLSAATADRILPPSLMNAADGLTGPDFTAAYGGVDDPRYLAATARIDATLDREGL